MADAPKTPIERVLDFVAGRGPNRIRLTVAQVDPSGNGGCRRELAAILAAHPEISYAYDPFLERWTLSRRILLASLFPQSQVMP